LAGEVLAGEASTAEVAAGGTVGRADTEVEGGDQGAGQVEVQITAGVRITAEDPIIGVEAVSVGAQIMVEATVINRRGGKASPLEAPGLGAGAGTKKEASINLRLQKHLPPTSPRAAW
jgi:hypothetical protein